MSGRTQNDLNSYTPWNKAVLIRGGADYFSKMEEMINAAHTSIHLHVYIYDEDETGRRIADALINAVQRKVIVYLLVDGYASQDLSEHFIEKLKAAGIHFAYFKQMFRGRDFYIGRRLHSKVIVVDAEQCMVSGINISNRYNDMNGIAAWMDWAVYDVGDAATVLYKYCIDLWNRSILREKITPVKLGWPLHSVKEKCLVRVKRNDWVSGQTGITKSYREMFRKAHEHIIIMSAYFGPSARILRKMEHAAVRGVKVQLILASRTDVNIMKHAERYIYRRLLKNNIEIYEYQANVLHGKVAVYDNKWATVGSYNVNNISAFASVELNLEIKDHQFAATLNDTLEKIIAEDCVQINSTNYYNGFSFWHHLWQPIAYWIVHFIFLGFTFYFRQEKMKD